MKYVTLNFISPNFGDEKLESASFEDLVDVFEDRIKHWFLHPAERLLEIPHCQISAVALLMAYFEGIEIYQSGKDSKSQSFPFFAKGFSKVFPLLNNDERLLKTIHSAIYDQVRCGFAHDGMFRNRVFFSNIPSKPIICSFPKINGVLDSSQIESIVINPKLLFESVKNHFEDYLKILRKGTDLKLKQNFEAIVKLKWALDEKDRAIGMTEEKFYRT
ncbi:MAG TPA: hypothetical protein PLN06_07635 [Bacteroidales bacterium]|jgi:hypothetical protein|nr:hypothetical protein [Prolixibacteraceae bacterium]HOU96479.1 hypothetical protein [Bacteroidales bacterium]HPD57990.1 hypothetical protein [Smithellaceae bacterium]